MTTEPKLLTEAEWRERINAPPHFTELAIAALDNAGLIAEEPVDPLLVEAREICQRVSDESGEGHYRRYLEGDWDNGHTMKVALAALRRNMELAPRKELTREMVIAAVLPNVTGESYAINYSAIQSALTEALQ